MFCATPTKELAGAFYDDMKARAVRHGRRPEQLRIFPGAVIYAGESDAHAREKNSRRCRR